MVDSVKVQISLDLHPEGNLLELTGGMPGSEKDTLGMVSVDGVLIAGHRSEDYLESSAPLVPREGYDRVISVVRIDGKGLRDICLWINLNSETGDYYVNRHGDFTRTQVAVVLNVSRTAPAEKPQTQPQKIALSLLTRLQMATILLESGTDRQKEETTEWLMGLQDKKDKDPVSLTLHPSFTLKTVFDASEVFSVHSYWNGRPASRKDIADVIRVLENVAEELTEDLVKTREGAEALATHKHYKGGLYRYKFDLKHSESGEVLVGYQHLWPHEYGHWGRPKEMFHGNLEDGTKRFELIKGR